MESIGIDPCTWEEVGEVVYDIKRESSAKKMGAEALAKA
jgi:hypothetical protein